MRYILFILAIIFVTWGNAQDTILVFQSSAIDLNLQGKNTKKTLEFPMVITVDLAQMTVAFDSDMPEVRELFRNKMTRPIDSTMGEFGDEFSLVISKNIFAHFYLDERNLILFTRNDIHPLKWGMMLKEVELGQE